MGTSRPPAAAISRAKFRACPGLGVSITINPAVSAASRVKTPRRSRKFVLYPGEGHGNQRAAARYDYNIRLMRWMDRYLTGPGGAPPEPRFELPEGTVGTTASE